MDQFLDGDVNWLEELKRLSEQMPPSEDLIVRSLHANADPRNGGGTFNVVGSVRSPDVIDQFEVSLRDDHHQVFGDSAKEKKDAEGYSWSFTESIRVDAVDIRNQRYERIQQTLQAESNQDKSSDETSDASSTEASVDLEAKS